ncbi:hypothetical protein HMPREF3160_06505 [Arthrobacter sp. HMSC06H05]|uniref:biliverdin-producing heme oxygenase n=1 Tax=Arthrobacter sp. HMSC06H05 TaxID=1581128 RepID=UPI0008A2458A|nr:biliverdin-producing heme oxygenase [Arthrobacter sp. HMSC06H05]OFT41982.1 hypothetical protein HMPREF3160_06505 [Arthrobacter sp. HMSC06H05]
MTAPPTHAPSFATQLKTATRAEHAAAEHSSFIQNLMEGKLSAEDYVRLLAQYQPLYRALEKACARWRCEPSVRQLLDPALERSESIRNDLAGLTEYLGIQMPDLTTAVTLYTQRIHEVGAMASPERLIAHHYLRYLGDLSGGQAIGALVARHYNIPSELLTMWKFPTIDKPKIYKDTYRIHLDHFAQQANQAEIVDEARLGFALNRNLFVELGAPLSDNKDLYV